MNTQIELSLGRALKELGVLRATIGKNKLLDSVREVARGLAIRSANRAVTADDVCRECKRVGLDFEALGNAAGSLFRGSEWEFTGDWRQSSQPRHHARAQRVWRLK